MDHLRDETQRNSCHRAALLRPARSPSPGQQFYSWRAAAG